MDVKSHLSSISDEQAANVRKMLSDTGKSEESKAQTKSEPHKKKFTAVFRPQNAQQHTQKAAQFRSKSTFRSFK